MMLINVTGWCISDKHYNHGLTGHQQGHNGPVSHGTTGRNMLIVVVSAGTTSQVDQAPTSDSASQDSRPVQQNLNTTQ